MRLSLVSFATAALSIGSVVASHDFSLHKRSSLSSKPLLGTYWPAYYSSEIQGPKSLPWKETDLSYYFVAVTRKFSEGSSFTIGPGQDEADIKVFTSEAKKYGKKSLVSIGGWSGSIQFSNLVATEGNRERFAKDVKEFMNKYGFDGVDLDYEYPNSPGIGCNSIRDKDSANLLTFLKVLRREIGQSKLITAAVSTSPFVGPDGTPLKDVSAFAQYFDYLNLMTYDISGSWSPTTGPLSPLRSCGADASVTSSVEAWSKSGFPLSKLNVGIPSYATSWTTESSQLSTVRNELTSPYGGSKLFQKFTEIPKGNDEDVKPKTDECGVVSNQYSGAWKYNELVEQGMLSADGKRGGKGFTRYFDNCTQTPFLFNPKSRTLISYNDAQSAAAVSKFAKEKKLAGVFIFDSIGFKDSPNVYAAIRNELNA
ncbi:glycoside hydrolase family 18 protein [Sporobolomyces salmoneus]|uniref:glycoside hydrolase family 18 protein n=1 Tax=Sporobolomyces salmoneus TaxID=183962 RepID=UPI00317F99F5